MRKRRTILQTIALISVLIAVFYSLTNEKYEPSLDVPSNRATENLVATDSAEEVQKDQRVQVQFLKVVDGDTINVLIDGKEERIRIIGINTPETVDPRRPVECFGAEAKQKAEEIFNNNKTVFLEQDPSQSNRDRYNRLLRYIFLPDGTDYGKFMIENGFAYEYTYDSPYKYQIIYKLAQQKAQEEKRGLWAENAC